MGDVPTNSQELDRNGGFHGKSSKWMCDFFMTITRGRLFYVHIQFFVQLIPGAGSQTEWVTDQRAAHQCSFCIFEYIWYVLKCSYLKVIPNNSNKWIIVGKKWWTAVELYIFLVWLPITTWHTWLLKSGLHYFTFWASSETGHRLTTANVSVSACSHTQCASQTK